MLVDRYGSSLYDFDVIATGTLVVRQSEGNTMTGTVTLPKAPTGTAIFLGNVWGKVRYSIFPTNKRSWNYKRFYSNNKCLWN